MTPGTEIIGRSSSHFTRVALLFARELDVPCELVPVYDLTDTDPEIYAGHPALKLPVLRRPGSLVFGTENICRALVDLAPTRRRVVWPEEVRSELARNAQELVWHGMAAQVQLVLGTQVAKLPADNVYFAKARRGFEGALDWVDERLPTVLRELPEPRDLSLLEVTLFCLVEHVRFRGTVPIDRHAALVRFAEAFGDRPSARATSYRFDAPPESVARRGGGA